MPITCYITCYSVLCAAWLLVFTCPLFYNAAWRGLLVLVQLASALLFVPSCRFLKIWCNEEEEEEAMGTLFFLLHPQVRIRCLTVSDRQDKGLNYI